LNQQSKLDTGEELWKPERNCGNRRGIAETGEGLWNMEEYGINRACNSLICESFEITLIVLLY